MKIYLSLFAYALSDDLLRAWNSVNGPNVITHLFLHSRVSDVVAACEHIASAPNVVYHPYGVNRGVCRGINDTIHAAFDDSADVLVCWADDMRARPGDIDCIAKAVLAHPECAYVDSPCWVEKTGRNENTGMAMSMATMRKVGYFDVNCYPLAFGDVDWVYRAKLAGMGKFTALNTYLFHAGAKTRDAMPEAEGQFMRDFETTRDYYTAKWGGDYKHEEFDHPFNNPKLSAYIARENADNPYPEYARVDVIQA